MKKLIFLNCMLAVALIFSFCSKSDTQESLNAENPEAVVTERGTCLLTNIPSNTATLTLCGTNTNATFCSSCLPALSQGLVVYPGGNINLTLTTPITFSISSNINTAVNLPGLPPVAIGGGGCRVFHMDDNCNLTVIK